MFCRCVEGGGEHREGTVGGTRQRKENILILFISSVVIAFVFS